MAGRYSLNVIYSKNETEIIPLGNRNGIKEKALLEQIDYITSHFKNIEDFTSFVSKSFKFKKAPIGFFISYRANGETKKLDLIFDNQYIKDASMESLKKKVNKYEDKKLSIFNPFIKETVNTLKAYSLLSEYDKYFKRKSLFPYRTKNLLDQYKELINNKSATAYAELNTLNYSIASSISNYNDFRKIIIWLDIVNKKVNNNDNVANLLEYFESLLDVNFEITIEDDEVEDLKTEENYKNVNEDKEHNLISDEQARNIYMKTQNIDEITEELGEEKVKSLSKKDKYIIGI